MTDEIAKYIKDKCMHCRLCTDFMQCIEFDYDDLEIAAKKCSGKEKGNLKNGVKDN